MTSLTDSINRIKPPKEKKKAMSVYLGKEATEILDKLAKDNGVSQTIIVEALILTRGKIDARRTST